MDRDTSGRFGPGNRLGRQFPRGVSGNPGGLPARVREARELAGEHSPRAIDRLAALLDHEDPRVAIAAAEALLDRAGVSAVKVDLDSPATTGPPVPALPVEVMVGILMDESGHDPGEVMRAQENRLEEEARQLERRREAVRTGAWRRVLDPSHMLPGRNP